MIKIILPGSVRSKKNSKVATMVGGRNVPRRAIIIPSKAYTKWEKQVRASLWEQIRYAGLSGKNGGLPLTGPISVKAVVYFKGAEPDLSGCLESVGDCLEGYLYENDRQIKSWDGSRTFHDLKNPRTEITIEAMEG